MSRASSLRSESVRDIEDDDVVKCSLTSGCRGSPEDAGGVAKGGRCDGGKCDWRGSKEGEGDGEGAGDPAIGVRLPGVDG